MKEIIQDDLFLCRDCTLAAVNNDYSGLQYFLSDQNLANRIEEIIEGLKSVEGILIIFSDSEGNCENDLFSRSRCGCCGSNLAGNRTRFAILG